MVVEERSERRKRTGWIATVGLAVGMGLVAAAWFGLRHKGNAPQPQAAGKIESLAVLPLRNLSGDPAQQYLADGMTEALIGELAHIHNLRVISHTSVMRFQDGQTSAPEIARTLNVDALVEGSVIREGNRIRVTAQLIRGTTDEHFWSESYDRELRDALALESEVARGIADRVEVTVSGDEQRRLTQVRAVAPEVYVVYLKGRSALERSRTRNEIEESLQFFKEAVREDPKFAPAYAGMANAYGKLGTIYFGEPPAETRARTKSAAEKALSLDPDLAEAHELLGNVLESEWHWGEAETEYRRALELNPNSAEAHNWLARWLSCQGREDEAVAEGERGRQLEPGAYPGLEVAWVLFLGHRFKDAERELRSGLAVEPGSVEMLWYLGFVLIAENRPDEAVPLLEKAAAMSQRSPGVLGVLVRAYAHAGRRSDALRVLEELKERSRKQYVPAGALVNAYLGLDDKEQAFVWLGRAYREQSNLLQYLKVHPYFDPVRDDPRFVDLQRRVGLN
jgi:TolB-like protein/tetratricopeptide (TPR) repeat protein